MSISSKIKSLVGICLLTAFFFGIIQSAEATTYTYPPDAITTNQTNATFNSNEIVAGQPNTSPPLASDPGVTFTTVEIGGSLLSGDVVRLHYIQWDGTETIHDITSLPYTASPGSYCFYYQLITSSTSGYRQTCYVSATNNDGVTRIWEDPLPPEGSTGTTTTINVSADYSGVVDKLNTISTDVNKQFNEVKGKLGDIHDYFTIPRQPEPYTATAPPEITYDPEPPTIEEPYMQPYVYDRTEPITPPAINTPTPLPYAPDPEQYIVDHDEPALIEDPTPLNAPIQKQDMLQLDPVIKQPPLTQDPVIKEPPLTLDPVNVNTPLLRDEPITAENPMIPGSPLTPDPPITPSPPLAPS